jgi:hypothetical protein
MSTRNENAGSAVLLVVLAVVALAAGIAIGTGAPSCGGETMSPGDSCYSYRHGTKSYDEVAADAASAPLWGGLVALGLVVAAIVTACRGNDEHRGAPGRATSLSSRPAATTTAASTAAMLPLARTPAEAHLAMSLIPCSCGATDFGGTSALFRLDGRLVRLYWGRCRSCRTAREFLFRLPSDAT